jgi:hypothetical protein
MLAWKPRIESHLRKYAHERGLRLAWTVEDGLHLPHEEVREHPFRVFDQIMNTTIFETSTTSSFSPQSQFSSFFSNNLVASANKQ